jgi:hypothetical protein
MARIDRKRVWLSSPADRIETPRWFACLKRYGKGKRHDMKSVRESIAKARRDGRI